ncbi:nesprin-4 isoform X1 [Grammomys surdaster]|uniref:nesprin-4 isoform X1 n=1 Tax=Grammomys surdaster TaxID=491861 RepID=UPI00109F3BAA|nr:nesprin-4 isoform X1 [Grammomys surdaster]
MRILLMTPFVLGALCSITPPRLGPYKDLSRRLGTLKILIRCLQPWDKELPSGSIPSVVLERSMASEKHPQGSSLLGIGVVCWPTGPDFGPLDLQHSDSGLEVLEAEQDSLHLCLLRLNFRLQDLEQGLGSWTLAHNRMVQLQALQAELRGAADRVDALLAFGEGLAERSEPRAWASLEQVLRALGTHRDTIFQRLWQLQAQLISYSLVLEKANLLDQDLEVEGDSDGPAAGGVWGPWAPSTFPTPAELEWDPAGDVGGLGPSGQKISRIPGVPCELCGYRGPQSSGQGLEDLLSLGLGHRKHLAAHHRRRLRKPQDKKRQVSPSLPDVMLQVDHGVPTPASRRPLTLFFLLLFLLLVGATLLLPLSGVPCCSHARLARTPYLVLSYVNGLPPI